MIAWRLVKTRYVAEPLAATGAARDGGRWNPVGTPLVYCSCALSLAALEVLVHVRAGIGTVHYHAVQIDVPDDSTETMRGDTLPTSWRNTPCDPTLQALGREWVASLRSLALRVPSVIVPQESNLLLNPSHADFASVRVTNTFPFVFDPRLLPARV